MARSATALAPRQTAVVQPSGYWAVVTVSGQWVSGQSTRRIVGRLDSWRAPTASVSLVRSYVRPAWHQRTVCVIHISAVITATAADSTVGKDVSPYKSEEACPLKILGDTSAPSASRPQVDE